MIHTVRVATVLATALLAAPAFAQPGAPDATTGPSSTPPVTAGTVVIVTPEQPVVTPPAGQPGVQPAAAPAPQNHDWRNVSHINGQIVKVGESGEYLYENGKHTNISTNPIGLLLGFYGASVAVALNSNIAIRGDVNLYSFGNNSGHEVGVSVPIYFRRTFSGPFLEPGVVTRNLDENCDSCKASTGPEVMFGWHWMFDSGLNVAMAVGALRNMTSTSRSIDAEPTGYFRCGYAF